jgi:O-succinylbenzoate synthase
VVIVKIESFSLYSYRLPLNRTLQLRNVSTLEREGLLIRFSSEDGEMGWGEIAPLPGFSEESLTNAIEQAAAIARKLVGRPIPKDLNEIDRALAATSIAMYPSVRCGIEGALLHWLAEIEDRAIRFTDRTDTPSTVPLNGLLTGDTESILQCATLLVNQGYRAVKVKLGQRSLEDDIALTYRLHARIDGKASLRLDINRAWSFDQAIAFGKGVEVLPIEYVEEPLQESGRLAELAASWKLPIALDESLVEMTPKTFQPFHGLKVFILKPMLLGGFARAHEWASCASKAGIVSVVSSSFESAVGLTMLGHLASQVGPGIPCGLDTSDWFVENLLERPLPISAGSLQLEQKRTLPTDVRIDKLTEVTHG